MSDRAPAFPAAVLFDMDGTLTEPMLDFPQIKREMGIGDRPILEAMSQMADADRKAAEAILHRHEDDAAANSTLNPGCREILDYLRDRQTPIALITRNSAQSVKTVLARHRLTIEILLTRDDPPIKPHPEPLLVACRRLNRSPDRVWMVGDGHFDVEAGVAAKIHTVWLSHHRKPDFAARPNAEVANLIELLSMLKELESSAQSKVG